ncbi:MAG: glycosyltransferase family 87 protein, partial [Gaiellaceae bacterium]
AMPLGEGASVRTIRIREAGRRVAEWVLFGFLPVSIFCWWLGFAVLDSTGDWAFDFRQFWQGGNDVVDGVSPYPGETLLASAGDHLDSVGIQEVFRFPYPAGAAAAAAPFGALDFDVAAAIWGVLLIVSLLAGIWMLGVRDWRVLGVVIGSAPVIGAVRIGTMTPVLILLLAVVWRWRDRAWVAGGSLAVAIALKLFLWPLVVWLAATRRWTAAVGAAGLAVAMTLVAWAAIGFDGFTDYPELVRRLVDVVAERGFSLVALGVEAGLPDGAARALMWLVGLSLLAAAGVVARRVDGDRRAFSLVTVAALALTPIVWLHYFALLVVPLALARPRLAWAWGLMWAFWLVPAQESDGDLWRIVLATAVAGAALAVSAAGPILERVRAKTA